MDVKHHVYFKHHVVSRFGLAVRRWAGKQKDLGSNLFRLCFLFKSCGLWTLSCDFVPHSYETLKWLSSLPTLKMRKSFWWWQCSNKYIISRSPHLHTLFPSLISLMVSVDVKHHVYLAPCLLTLSNCWNLNQKTHSNSLRKWAPPPSSWSRLMGS